MSFEAMAAVVGIDLPAREKLVLLLIANRISPDTGSCYPSIGRLARDCGMSESSVRRAIKSLCDRGILSVDRSGDGPNIYSITPCQSDRGGVNLTGGGGSI